MIAMKEDAALAFARAHFEAHMGVTEVYQVLSANEENDDEPIKLLEVNSETIERGIEPIIFGPSKDIPYSLIVIDISPREFDLLQKKVLSLPSGWRMGRKLAG